MSFRWNPEDFGLDQERDNNSGDQHTVLLRKLTGALSASGPLYTRPANINGEPLNTYLSSLGEQSVSERTQLFDVRPLYGLTELRDVTSSTQGATVSHGVSEFVLSTEASASSACYLETAEHGRYYAGIEMLGVTAVRYENNPVGEQVFTWGYFNDSDGFYFGKDVTGSFVAIKNSGSISKQIYQTDWNLDKLDGTGLSQYNIESFIGSGHIYTVRFLWHGYGFIEWIVSTFGEKNQQIDTVVHRERVTGSISTRNPHLPMRASVDNNNTAQSASLFTTCRSVSINGRYTPHFRTTSEKVINKNISTTFKPIISFKRGNILENLTNIRLGSVEFLADGNALWEIRLNSDLTGSSFGIPSTTIASETTVQSDVSATGSSGGIFLTDGILEGGAGSKVSAATRDLPDLDFPLDRPVTLLARSVTSTVNITAIFKIKEEW